MAAMTNNELADLLAELAVKCAVPDGLGGIMCVHCGAGLDVMRHRNPPHADGCPVPRALEAAKELREGRGVTWPTE